MAKTCPITRERVLYLDCQECEEREDCEKMERSNSFSFSVAENFESFVKDSVAEPKKEIEASAPVNNP